MSYRKPSFERDRRHLQIRRRYEVGKSASGAREIESPIRRRKSGGRRNEGMKQTILDWQLSHREKLGPFPSFNSPEDGEKK